jgi:hypothetical protein
LVTVGGLDLAVGTTRELKSVSWVDVCVETVRYVLREVGLGSAEKVSKSVFSTKNIKEMSKFAKMHKDWIVRD